MNRNLQLPISILLFALAIGLAEKGHAAGFVPTAIAQTHDGQWVEEYTFTLDPGESVPWHYHAGGLAIIVTSGNLTEDRGCGLPLETHGAGVPKHQALSTASSMMAPLQSFC